MSTKATINKAIERCRRRSATWVRMAPAALISNDAKVVDFVFKQFTREDHSIELLRRRLRRNKPPVTHKFRVRWWSLITMLGASALFAWCIIMVLDRLAS